MTSRSAPLFVLISICCLWLGGCTSFFRVERRKVDHYVLAASQKSGDDGIAVNAHPVNKVMVVNATTAPEALNGSRILFARDVNRRGHYQYAAWLEPPAQSFYRLLLHQLRETPLFRDVLAYNSLLDGDYLLNSSILEMYHDVTSPLGLVRIRVDFEFIDLNAGKVVDRLEVVKAVSASTNDADGAVLAFNKAISEVLLDLKAWLAGVVKGCR